MRNHVGQFAFYKIEVQAEGRRRFYNNHVEPAEKEKLLTDLNTQFTDENVDYAIIVRDAHNNILV